MRSNWNWERPAIKIMDADDDLRLPDGGIHDRTATKEKQSLGNLKFYSGGPIQPVCSGWAARSYCRSDFNSDTYSSSK